MQLDNTQPSHQTHIQNSKPNSNFKNYSTGLPPYPIYGNPPSTAMGQDSAGLAKPQASLTPLRILKRKTITNPAQCNPLSITHSLPPNLVDLGTQAQNSPNTIVQQSLSQAQCKELSKTKQPCLLKPLIRQRILTFR